MRIAFRQEIVYVSTLNTRLSYGAAMNLLLPEDLKTKVKERLRYARFVVREIHPQVRRSSELSVPNSAKSKLGPGLTHRISEFSDDALQKLETMAIGFLSSDPDAHFGEARVYPLARYFGPDQSTAQALFARDCYFASKQILRAKGCSNPRLSEELYSIAHRCAFKDWGRSTSTQSIDAVAHDAAVMSLAVMRAKAVRSPLLLQVDGGTMNAGIYVASALGLAAAVATFHHASLGIDEPIYSSVCAAVDARYDMLEQTFDDEEDAVPLGRLFADLVPHLP